MVVSARYRNRVTLEGSLTLNLPSPLWSAEFSEVVSNVESERLAVGDQIASKGSAIDHLNPSEKTLCSSFT